MSPRCVSALFPRANICKAWKRCARISFVFDCVLMVRALGVVCNVVMELDRLLIVTNFFGYANLVE